MKLKPSTVTDLHFYCLSSFLLRLFQKNEQMERKRWRWYFAMKSLNDALQCTAWDCVRFQCLVFMNERANWHRKIKTEAPSKREKECWFLKKSVKTFQARCRNKSRTFTEACSEAMICWHCSHCAIAESREWTKTEMKKKASTHTRMGS